jgi:hypothetical protein
MLTCERCFHLHVSLSLCVCVCVSSARKQLLASGLAAKIKIKGRSTGVKTSAIVVLMMSDNVIVRVRKFVCAHI